ncbi:MAG: deoxyribose-phosphate aldolase [Chloroflexi bacterium]|nr:deoxyribose-phosphate aldolase [Anaerolineaceae bacterium]NMB86985.1 deoxyribose-phosphate aldolase [Chloroflexota bacterium]
MAPQVYDSKTITVEQLAKMIDHSLLRPEMTREEVIAGCELAKKYHVASVCVKPCHVKLAKEILAGSDVAVGTVVGFPHGAATTEIKAAEARLGMEHGAVELDMVLNIGELRSGNAAYVRDDIKAVVDVANGKAIVKVIFENSYLNDEQKILACKLCEEAGADFVKTSTGYSSSGMTVEDLRLMRANVSPKVQVKAAHGIRTLQAALSVVDAGATRFGATQTATILDDLKKLREGSSMDELKSVGDKSTAY